MSSRGFSRLVVVVLATASLGVSAVAWATFSSQSSASHSITTATLRPATALTATKGTCTIVPPAQTVNLAWTATSSTFADGYEIFRAVVSGGPYISIGTVSGQATAAYSDTTVLASTTYYYVVQAKKINWRSADSAQASVTTLSAACV